MVDGTAYTMMVFITLLLAGLVTAAPAEEGSSSHLSRPSLAQDPTSGTIGDQRLEAAPISGVRNPDGHLIIRQPSSVLSLQGSEAFGSSSDHRPLASAADERGNQNDHFRQQGDTVFQARVQRSADTSLGSTSDHRPLASPGDEAGNQDGQLNISEHSPVNTRLQGSGGTAFGSTSDQRPLLSVAGGHGNQDSQLNIRDHFANNPHRHENRDAILGSASDHRPVIVPVVSHSDSERQLSGSNYPVVQVSGLNIRTDIENATTLDPTDTTTIEAATTTTEAATATDATAVKPTTSTATQGALSFLSSLFSGGLSHSRVNRDTWRTVYTVSQHDDHLSNNSQVTTNAADASTTDTPTTVTVSSTEIPTPLQ
ncbi:serine-rich adhesin for platelets [Cherax quadricarinatus]